MIRRDHPDLEHQPAVPVVEAEPVVFYYTARRRRCGDAGVPMKAIDRVLQIPVLRVAPDRRLSLRRDWDRGGASPCPAAVGEDGPARRSTGGPNQPASSSAPGLPVSAAGAWPSTARTRSGAPTSCFMFLSGTAFLYLVAIMDWATRKVLSWRLSNTMRRLLRRGVEGSHQKVRSARSPNTIKGRSSPDRPGSHADQKKPACAYPWMAGAGAWITSSSNACGESLKQEAVYL
ncbi:hypothetical protein ACFOHS_22570, partial [Jhaorihella thermophila]